MNGAERRGRRAQEILDDEVFAEAQAMAEQQVKDEWANESSQQRREALWHSIQGGSPVVRALRTIAGRGEFAVHERTREEKRIANG